MGVFVKKRSTKTRIIHDLSFPPGESVNSGIRPENCSVSFISVDNAVAELKKKGVGALQCKIDLEDAYKSIVVNPNSWYLQGSTLTLRDGLTLYFVDYFLPFGLRTSARVFNNFASALEFLCYLTVPPM